MLEFWSCFFLLLLLFSYGCLFVIVGSSKMILLYLPIREMRVSKRRVFLTKS